eukprot:jgi/Undpi1/12088/HiC_scaffold_4.g01786.m1
MMNCRKRFRLELDGAQPLHRLEDGPFEEGGVIHAGGGGLLSGVTNAASRRAVRGHLKEATVATAGNSNLLGMPRDMTALPLADEHQSVEAIKTEMGLVVLF